MTNIQRLNNIYKSGIDKTWSNTEIPDKLIEYLDYLKSKVTSYSKLKVLDIGCGRGRLIKRMIEDGWEDVTGIEVAGEAIKYLPPRIKLKIIVGDFMEERFNKKYDIITDLTMTCSVSPRHWSSIFRKINEILEGNGYYLGEFFMERMSGSKLDKTWYLKENDLRNALSGWFVFFLLPLVILGKIYISRGMSGINNL